MSLATLALLILANVATPADAQGGLTAGDRRIAVTGNGHTLEGRVDWTPGADRRVVAQNGAVGAREPDLGEGLLLMAKRASGRVFYVDPDGSNANDGRSPGSAWATVSKVNSFNFQPGDVIAFKRGETWTETLNLRSSGEAGKLIEVTAYGSGAAPVFDGEQTRSASILITTDYVRYSNLHATNAVGDGVRIKDGASHGELIDIEASFNGSTNNGKGVFFLGNVTGWLVVGGAAYDNGGSGYNFNGGAHDNLLVGVETYNNRNDGIQWGLTSGDNNNLLYGYMHHNYENNLDQKAGRQTIEHSILADSRQGSILSHQNAESLTLHNNVIQSPGDQRLIFMRNGYSGDLDSDGNTWIYPNMTQSQAIKLGGTGTYSFANETYQKTLMNSEIGGDGADNLTGTSGIDLLWGGGGNDTLSGGGGDDFLFGGPGNDILRGGAGRNVILGGRGNDVIDAGQGDNIIRYESLQDGVDQVTAFSSGDVIDLDGLLDSLGVATNQRAGKVDLVKAGGEQQLYVDDTLLATIQVIANEILHVAQNDADVILGSL